MSAAGDGPASGRQPAKRGDRRPRCYRRTTCRLCDGDRLSLVLSLAPSPPVDAYVPAERLDEPQEKFPLDLFLCRACGHVQLLDVVDPELLFGRYIYQTSSSPGLADHFRRYSEAVCRAVEPAPKSLVVDIGSNDGTLLRFFKEAGLRALGVDPAREIARHATDSGIETIPAFFTDAVAREIRKTHGPASVVCANNVFAHMDDLGGVADGVRTLIDEDGVFVFEVHYLLDLVERMVFDFVYHEHLCYHSVRPLEPFLRRHDLELTGVQRVPTKGGSIRCFARPLGVVRSRASSVAALVGLEAAAGLDGPEVFRAFGARVDSVKKELGDQLRGLKAKGAAIAGYGASATVTVLIHHLDLGHLLDFLVDDDSSRQALFSPGFHLPVLAPSALYERRPDYVVVLAWRFSELIVKRHRAYLDHGGHFIVPLPRVELV